MLELIISSTSSKASSGTPYRPEEKTQYGLVRGEESEFELVQSISRCARVDHIIDIIKETIRKSPINRNYYVKCESNSIVNFKLECSVFFFCRLRCPRVGNYVELRRFSQKNMFAIFSCGWGVTAG